MVIVQGEVWWADLGEPIGSAPGFYRPILILQCDDFNRSRIATVLVVSLTSQLKWADNPGNLILNARETGLDQDSVANASQISSIDRRQLGDRVGQISDAKLVKVLDGVCRLIGR